MSKKRKGTNPREDWSTKELKEYIKKATAEAEQRISEYLGLERRGRTGIHFRKSVKELRKVSGTKSKNLFKISLNLNKKKSDLLKQAKELQKFLKRKSTKDITEKAIKQEEIKEEIRRQRVEYDLKKQKELEEYRNEIEERAKNISVDDSYTDVELEPPADDPFDDPKKERAYQTYKDRYNSDLSRDEYDDLIDLWNAIDPYLESFGYERNKGNYTPASNTDIIENTADLLGEYEDWQIERAMEAVVRMKRQSALNKEYMTPMAMLVELDVVLENLFKNEDEQ